MRLRWWKSSAKVIYLMDGETRVGSVLLLKRGAKPVVCIGEGEWMLTTNRMSEAEAKKILRDTVTNYGRRLLPR